MIAMAPPVPIKNIYYLLSYAWNRLSEGSVTDVSTIESTELVDLFAAVLASGINHLMRRGLDSSYISQEGEIAGVRGRIDVSITVRRMLTLHGRTNCRFDELRVDTLPNQILRATVRTLLKAKNLDGELRKRLLRVDRELGPITLIPLTKTAFRLVQLHGNNRYYRFLLAVCELVLDMSLVDETKGEFTFRDFIRDERAMARLFESFIFNFIRIERPDLDVRRERIHWAASSDADSDLHYLPTMVTDVSIRDRPHTRTLIVEAKFYRQTFQKNYDRQTIHSGNLYQLFAYLKNLELREGPDALAKGVLIYPTVEKSIHLRYRLDGHPLEIRTLNLAADWRDIRTELHSLVEP